MRERAPRSRSGARVGVLTALIYWLATSVASAAPLPLTGIWVEPPASLSAQRWSRPDGLVLAPVAGPRRTGGRFWYEATLEVPHDGVYVVDFKNSATIARFRQLIFDAQGARVFEGTGGIASDAENPFFLRHGRDVFLRAGRYHLRTELSSAFLLGQPEPYVEPLREYRQSIKLGHAVNLLGLGVLFGLGFYYAALALWRRRLADTMYTAFIAGNFLYNGSALLLFSQLFGAHWFYLVSVPVLFSNAAYVVFVMALLEVTHDAHPRLHRAGVALLSVFAGFIILAALFPNWSLELDRVGVALFTTFGLVTAMVRAREGSTSARLYLVAIATFFLLALLAISLSRVSTYVLYIEHLGLIAVVVEAALLALVLAHQFSLLHSERESAEDRAREGHRIAHSDALTGLPNRSALDVTLAQMPPTASLTFIDLDGLKHYNDKYGHQTGDALLCSFAHDLERRLGDRARLFRLSGDEFAITCPRGDVAMVREHIDETIATLRRERFHLAGASSGSVHVHECPTQLELKHLADTRMYEEKRRRRPSVQAEWARDSRPPASRSSPPPADVPEATEVPASRARTQPL